MTKRKRISTELKKSYIIIIVIFLFFTIFSLFQSWKYVYDLNKQQLKHSMDFLKNDIKNLKNSNEVMNIFYGDIVENKFKKESKSLEDLDVYINYNGNYYTETDDTTFPVKKLDKVFYDFEEESLVLSEEIPYKNSFLNITLVKDLDDDLDILERIMEIFLWVIAGAIIISLFISRYILKIVNNSLKEIMTLNENISLDNLNLMKPKNNFLEFENIYNSYEKMLKNLDTQNQQQIQFIHSSSHELKTPLFIMSGNLDLLEKYGFEDRELFNDGISSLKNEVKDMNSLVEKLLFIARSNDIPLEKEIFEVSDTILEVVQTLKRVYKNVKIDFDPEFIEINGDIQLFQLLIKNLLENAIKYGDSKPVLIKLKDQSRYLEIIIKDSGIGMTRDEVKQIFDKFYRADASRNKKVSGYGLGMSIVKRVVEVTESDIYIKSEKGFGTEITLKIKK